MSDPINGSGNGCFWPFSLWCGGSSTAADAEKQPLRKSNHGTGEPLPRPVKPDNEQEKKPGGTPGTTPTQNTTVKEQHGQVDPDEFF